MLEKAKANGAKIIAVNPLPEAGLIRFKDPQKVHGVVGHGVPIADEFVQIRLGGDMALFAGMGRLLLEADDAAPGTVVDRDFIDTLLRRIRRVRSRRRARWTSTPCWRPPASDARPTRTGGHAWSPNPSARSPAGPWASPSTGTRCR